MKKVLYPIAGILCLTILASFVYFDKIRVFSFGGIDLIKDVSELRDHWHGYEYKLKYILLRDVFLIRVDSGLDPERLALTPEGTYKQVAGLYIAPQTIEAYESDSKKATFVDYGDYQVQLDVVGVVRSGTILRCSKLYLHRNLSWFYGYQADFTMYADIVNGRYANKIVDIADISTICGPKDKNGRIRRTPDYGIVQRVSTN